MKIFSPLYKKVMQWSKHPHAIRYLGALSFAESSFFPIPPDVMLAPMSLSKPQQAMYYALITTITSVLGGIAGYFIGSFLYEWIAFLITDGGIWEDKYVITHEWFVKWGVLAIFVAGFSPIPYKIFTITAGIMAMAFVPFVLASIVGRGARFFLLAYLIKLGGEKMEQNISRYIDYLGWLFVVLLVVLVILYKI